MPWSIRDGSGGTAAPRPARDGAAPLERAAGVAGHRLTPFALLGFGALASAILTLLAIVDAGRNAAVWFNGHWALSAATALAATLAARRGTTGRDRRYRDWLAATLALWTLGQSLWVAYAIAGWTFARDIADIVLALAVLPVIGWQVDRLDPFPRATRLTILLDSGLVVLAVVGILVVAASPLAEAAATHGGYGYLAFAMVLFGGAAGVLVLAIEGGGRPAVSASTILAALGLATLGAGTMLWIGAIIGGIGNAPSSPLNVLFTIGPFLLGAAGVLNPGKIRVEPVPEPSRRIGVTIPFAAAVGAVAVVLVAHGLDRATARMLEVLTAAAILTVVVRQTVLYLDQAAASERERRATERARSAAEETARTAARLAEAEAQFRGLVERTPAVVYVDRFDREGGRVTQGEYISPRIESMTGFSPAEIMADDDLWMRQVHDEDRAEVVAAWHRHCTEEAPFSVAYRFVAKDGRVLWLAEDALIISRSESSSVSQGIIVDITERRELDDRLRSAQRMETVGQLAGGVAHDFNNLLTVINGHADMLLGTIPEDDSRREDASAISSAAGSAAALVAELLAFGRRQVVRPQVLDLSNTIESIVPTVARLLPESVRIVTSLEPDLFAVRVDPDQIRQIVLNLAIGARDAMPAGGSLRVQTGNRRIGPAETTGRPGLVAGDYVELTIVDDGPGMDAASRARAFEPYFTSRVGGRGTGLGLATVYGIVKQSNGYITLDSSAAGGSTVRVLLPAAEAEAETSPAPLPDESPAGQEHILVCEDEPSVRDLVTRVLRRAGYGVTAVSRPSEAISHLVDTDLAVDLLLSDVAMPEMSGLDLVRRAVVSRPGLPVILMSGYADDEEDRRALGADITFVAKPFSPRELTAAIRATLSAPTGDLPAIG